MHSPAAFDDPLSPGAPASGAAGSASASATAPAASVSATAPVDPASGTEPANPASATASASASVTAPADPASATAPASVPIGVPAAHGDFTRPATPTLHVALPDSSADAVRAALSVLSALPDRIEAQDRLDEDHAQLQREFRQQADEIARLKREMADTHTAAAPFVQHVQRQYDLLHHKFQEAVQRSAEFHSALIDRQADATELANLRARVQTMESHHAEEVAQLHAGQEDLAGQLEAAKRLDGGKAPRLAQRLLSTQAELAAALAARDQSLLDLHQVQGEFSALEKAKVDLRSRFERHVASDQ
jgi:hypothetical protein